MTTIWAIRLALPSSLPDLNTRIRFRASKNRGAQGRRENCDSIENAFSGRRMTKEKPIVEAAEKTKTIFSINALAPELQPKLVEGQQHEPAKAMGTVVLFPRAMTNKTDIEIPVEKI